jgi:hypothetical protein
VPAGLHQRPEFFITVTGTPWLNDVHTIFGRVTSGQTVVDAISQVATGADDKPLANVTLFSVGIRRVGAAAEDFDITAQNLPVVSGERLHIASEPGVVSLTFSNTLHTKNILATSTNLIGWTGTSLGVDVRAPATNSLRRVIASPAQFHALTQVRYPSSTFAPRTLRNRALTLSITGDRDLSIQFDAASGGTYTYGGMPGAVSYAWYQDIYRGYLWPILYSGGCP